MMACSGLVSGLAHFVSTVAHLLKDVACLTTSNFRSRSELAAENLFLRKQLALYQERGIKPRRAVDATRLFLVLLASSTGGAPSSRSSPTLSSAGAAKGFVCSGAGSPDHADDRRCPPSCAL